MPNNSDFTNNRTEGVPFAGQEIHAAARAIFVTVGTLMIVSGVIGNLLLVAVIFKRFLRKRCVHYPLFLVNLASADMLTMGYWLTFFVLDLILGYHPVANNAHCVANGLIVFTLGFVSVTSLVSISLNRYLHVCHTHLYKRLFTMRRTVFWCLSTWLVAILAALPPVWGDVGTYQYNSYNRVCAINRDGFTYPRIMVTVFSTVPVLFIGYWNFAIFRVWKKARVNLASRFPQFRNDKKRQKNVIVRWSARLTKWKDCMTTEQGIEVCEERSKLESQGDVSSTQDKNGQSVPSKDGSEIQITEPSEGENQIITVTKAKIENRFCDADDMARNVKDGADKLNADAMTSADSFSKDTSKEDTDIDATEVQSAEKQLDSKPENQPSNTDKVCTLNITEQSSGHTGDEIREDQESKTSSIPPSAKSKQRPEFCRSQKQHPSSAKQNLLNQRRRNKAREKAFIRSLFVVFIFMFISFIPYITIVITSVYIFVSSEIAILGNMLLFLNNAVNWIVYGAMNSEFRRGYIKFVRLLFFTCCPLGKKQEEVKSGQLSKDKRGE